MMKIEELIIKTLEEKSKKNIRYSIRAMARDIGIDQSHLTRVINKKLKPTPLLAYRLGQYMKYSNDQILELISQTLQ